MNCLHLLIVVSTLKNEIPRLPANYNHTSLGFSSALGNEAQQSQKVRRMHLIHVTVRHNSSCAIVQTRKFDQLLDNSGFRCVRTVNNVLDRAFFLREAMIRRTGNMEISWQDIGRWQWRVQPDQEKFWSSPRCQTPSW